MSTSLQLRGLVLARNFVADTGAAAIVEALQAMSTRTRQACRLEQLDLSENMLTAELGPVLAAALPKLTTLRSLVLSKNRLGDGGVVAMASALPRVGGPLEKLCLDSNDVGPRGFHAVANSLVRGYAHSNIAASLVHLNLSHNKYVHCMQNEPRGVPDGQPQLIQWCGVAFAVEASRVPWRLRWLFLLLLCSRSCGWQTPE